MRSLDQSGLARTSRSDADPVVHRERDRHRFLVRADLELVLREVGSADRREDSPLRNFRPGRGAADGGIRTDRGAAGDHGFTGLRARLGLNLVASMMPPPVTAKFGGIAVYGLRLLLSYVRQQHRRLDDSG